MKKRMWVFNVMFIISFTALINVACGQTNLTDLINYSLEHSRDVKKAELQVKEANFQRLETIGHGLPQVEASGNYSKMMLPEIEISDSIAMMIPSAYQPMLEQLNGLDALYTTSAGVQVTQLIYSQSYWVGVKTTKKAQELYEILKTKTEDEVIEEVANNYYQSLSLMMQLNTLDKSLGNLRELYRIVDLNYKNDFVKESSVNRLKVTITNIEVSQQTLKNAINIQLNYLKALAGMPSDTLLVVDTIISNNILPNGLNNGFAVENVPAYQILIKQNEISNQQIKLARAEYFPLVAAFGKFNYSSYSFKSDINLDKMNNMNTIGLQVNIPILSSGVNYSKVKQAQLKKAQLETTIAKSKDLLTVNYNNAYMDYNTAFSLLEVQKENRNLALKVYNQTSSQYKEGMASLADVLNVNSDFLQADNSYNQQILKCKLSEIKMMKATGSLKDLVNNK